MYALIENNEIKKIYNKPRALTIGDIQYPSNIFSLWSKEEKEAKGIYEVVFDNSNKKDEAYYNNTNQSFNYDNGVATASFGTATAKPIADSLWTQADSDNGDLPDDEEVGDVKVEGLKTKHKRIIKSQASGLLAPTDWYVIKATDVAEYSVPSAVTTFRSDVRTKSNEMEVLIDACSTVDELAALYAYTEQEDGSHTRPLGEFPEEV